MSGAILGDCGKLSVIAGGSNSLIHGAVAGSFDPRWSSFEDGKGRKAATTLRYRCCFMWVDVDAVELEEQFDRRVEEMVAAGMVEELRRYFEEEAMSKAGNRRHPGLGKAIGVAEFREYFQGETPAAYEAAIAAIKTNTRRLGEEQVKKIQQLGEMGWPLRRLDATAAVVGSATEAWERDVAVPAAATMDQFLKEAAEVHNHHHDHGHRHRTTSSALYLVPIFVFFSASLIHRQNCYGFLALL